ncbi:MAG: 4'-phosphopantetheinyl transferase superfamily protein [Muribaculaceae bacterium]|nr:4'-phosphopantetheinyl transferase superfamily protein [Muribaculaceae bacterium]
MDEKFPDEFVTWRHLTPPGIKVDEVFGMDSKSGKTWIQLAKQIYGEQGEPEYRVIEHFDNGAPFLEGYPGRISITHTDHFFAVASLPKTPETELYLFNTRTAMGIDAESISRAQVLKVRNKFLSLNELELVPEENIQDNILAWTSKEAVLKASMLSSIPFKDDITLISLPTLDPDPLTKGDRIYGKALLKIPQGEYEFSLYSYLSYGCCVTLAFSPKCAKFGKH